jgi:hypothetical protein
VDFQIFLIAETKLKNIRDRGGGKWIWDVLLWGVVECVTECDGWGGGGQRNWEKCGRRLWTAPSQSQHTF